MNALLRSIKPKSNQNELGDQAKFENLLELDWWSQFWQFGRTNGTAWRRSFYRGCDAKYQRDEILVHIDDDATKQHIRRVFYEAGLDWPANTYVFQRRSTRFDAPCFYANKGGIQHTGEHLVFRIAPLEVLTKQSHLWSIVLLSGHECAPSQWPSAGLVVSFEPSKKRKIANTLVKGTVTVLIASSECQEHHGLAGTALNEDCMRRSLCTLYRSPYPSTVKNRCHSADFISYVNRNSRLPVGRPATNARQSFMTTPCHHETCVGPPVLSQLSGDRPRTSANAPRQGQPVTELSDLDQAIHQADGSHLLEVDEGWQGRHHEIGQGVTRVEADSGHPLVEAPGSFVPPRNAEELPDIHEPPLHYGRYWNREELQHPELGAHEHDSRWRRYKLARQQARQSWS